MSNRHGLNSPNHPRPVSGSKKNYPKEAPQEPWPTPPSTGYNPKHHDGHKAYSPKPDGYEANGEKIIIEESSAESTLIKSKTTEIIEIGTKKDIAKITTGLLELLTIGETDKNGVIVVERGQYFLESIFKKLQFEIFEKWKLEFLFPAIKVWLEKYVVEYIEQIVIATKEKIIKEYEEKILILKEEQRLEIIKREEEHKAIYLEAIKRVWEAYEKRMQEIEVVKEVRFKFKVLEERETWGEFIKELAPELLECVPNRYEPDFRIENSPHYGIARY